MIRGTIFRPLATGSRLVQASLSTGSPVVLARRSNFLLTASTFQSHAKMFHGSSRVLAPALSQETIDIVKSTAPVLEEHGYTITSRMYGRMLQDPSVAEMFNPAHQVELKEGEKAQQPWSLACAVHAYAANVDNLGALARAVEVIAQKHVSLSVLPEHYDVVAENLIWAIGDVLGDAATPEVVKAWGEAYWFLADILIERERSLRDSKSSVPGGWAGWRDFVVDRKVVESDEIVSVYLKPKDEKEVIPYDAGSYIGIRLQVPGEKTTSRNYTLSKADDGSGEWRVTIKRQGPLVTGCPMGRVSNYVHDKLDKGDVVQLSVPCGEFVLDKPTDDKTPIVLLSGGVGVTPVAAMLEQLVNDKVKNNIFVVVAARSPEVEAMHDVLAQFRRKHLNVFIKTIYDTCEEGNYPTGPFRMEQLDMMLPHEELKTTAKYYFCGPAPFMKTVYRGLMHEWKVPQENVKFEFFGPLGDLE